MVKWFMINWANMLDYWLKVTDLDEYTTTTNDNITNSVLQPNNDWVQIPIWPPLSMRKGRLFVHFCFTTVKAQIFICAAVSAPNLRKGPLTVLDFIYFSQTWQLWHSSQEPSHSKFSLQDSKVCITNLWSNLQMKPRGMFSALFCVGVSFPPKNLIKF
jgi:hypothetical protein